MCPHIEYPSYGTQSALVGWHIVYWYIIWLTRRTWCLWFIVFLYDRVGEEAENEESEENLEKLNINGAENHGYSNDEKEGLYFL